MLRLFISNLKMLYRNRQALFWSLMFPLMFTVIFGFFFGSGTSSTGTVDLINQSNSPIATNLEKALKKSEFLKIQNSTSVEKSKELMKKNKITAVIAIPEKFGELSPTAPKKITLFDNPSNLQTNMTIMQFINAYLAKVDYQIQNVKLIFGVNEEKSSNRDLTYFDFVLVGLIGMALMNSSIQGIGITVSKYREDKILKRLTTTPLKPWKFIVAEVLARLIINFIQIALILSIGVYGFNANIYGNLFLIFLFALLGGVLFQSIGFMVASVSKTTAAAEGMSVAISIPMMFLAGVFFPIDQLPNWLFNIVKFLPLAPLLRMIRDISLENISPFTDPWNIVIVFAWIILMLLISIYKFRFADE